MKRMQITMVNWLHKSLRGTVQSWRREAFAAREHTLAAGLSENGQVPHAPRCPAPPP